jgi:hypothetical protein
VQYVCPLSLSAPFPYSLPDVLCIEFWQIHNAQSAFKLGVLQQCSLTGYTSHSNQNLMQRKKDGNSVLRAANDQGVL